MVAKGYKAITIEDSADLVGLNRRRDRAGKVNTVAAICRNCVARARRAAYDSASCAVDEHAITSVRCGGDELAAQGVFFHADRIARYCCGDWPGLATCEDCNPGTVVRGDGVPCSRRAADDRPLWPGQFHIVRRNGNAVPIVR